MINYSKWLGLPLSTRVLLAERFGIPKKGSIEVFSNSVIRDGYFVQDIENALTIDNLQKALDSKETDINVLFSDAVLLVQGQYETKKSSEDKGRASEGNGEQREVSGKAKVHKGKAISSNSRSKR